MLPKRETEGLKLFTVVIDQLTSSGFGSSNRT